MLRKLFYTTLLLLAVFILNDCTDTSVTSSYADSDDESTDGDAAISDGDIPDADGDATTDGDDDEDFQPPTVSYPIVDSNQKLCFDASNPIDCPAQGAPFAGQDAQYVGYQPRYEDNGDGTISDLVTGLMWQKNPGEKMTADAANAGADAFSLAGYDDWRMPTIKELYSLIRFSGRDPSVESIGTSGLVPFIDTDFFDFAYGDTASGERIIDSQWATNTFYVDDTEGGHYMFGVNFADGRIKGYGTNPLPGQPEGKLFFAIHVRGPEGYGENAFTDNGNGTITDAATGLMWQQADSGSALKWEDALLHCENMTLAGHDDWRLPSAKELQSIVDYSRSPGTSASAAINPLFSCTPITNEAGQPDYPFYWSSTTHARDTARQQGASAVYVAFGRAMGFMQNHWMDVHGAGAQRSDPKDGNPADYPMGLGPQGDAIRIYNHVRCVRAGAVTANYSPSTDGDGSDGDATDGDDTPTDGDAPVGPTPCTTTADCQQPGACPQDAVKGCSCEQTPNGLFCVPLCTTDADCPDPPDVQLVCGAGGICIPSGGPQGVRP